MRQRRPKLMTAITWTAAAAAVCAVSVMFGFRAAEGSTRAQGISATTTTTTGPGVGGAPGPSMANPGGVPLISNTSPHDTGQKVVGARLGPGKTLTRQEMKSAKPLPEPVLPDSSDVEGGASSAGQQGTTRTTIATQAPAAPATSTNVMDGSGDGGRPTVIPATPPSH